MAILPGGITSAEASGTPKTKGCIRSWKPWNWRTVRNVISGAGAIPSAEFFGTPEFQSILGQILGAGGIPSAEAFGSAQFITPGMYDWLYVANADRLIDWSKAGIWHGGVKGIPTYPVGVTMQTTNPANPYYLISDLTDATTAAANTASIVSAIAACSVDHAVIIPAGKFCVSGPTPQTPAITLTTRRVLRGASPVTTILSCITSSNIIGWAGASGLSTASNYHAIVSGYSRGSSTLDVGASYIGNFAVGNIVRIDQNNDPDLVSKAGVIAYCNYCGRDGSNGDRAMGEVARVASRDVGAHTITLNRPLHYNFEAEFSPEIATVPVTVENCGVENIHLTYEGTPTNGSCIRFGYSVGCWVSNCQFSNFYYYGVYPIWGTYQCEVRKNYVHHPASYGPGGGYGMRIFGYIGDSVFEDNIVYHCHDAIDLDTGGAGNVFAHNYARWNYAGSTPSWLQGGIDIHGAHPYMNLFEGNCLELMNADNYHGSSSHGMLFRNYFGGYSFGGNQTSNRRAMTIDYWQRYYSAIGNVLGNPNSTVYQIYPPYSSESDLVVYKLGCNCCSVPGTPQDALVLSTMLRHGNYDYVNDAIVWDGAISGHDIPDSLYATSKPSFFGSMTWPAFTPERVGFDPDNLNDIPASKRFKAYLISNNEADLFADQS